MGTGKEGEWGRGMRSEMSGFREAEVEREMKEQEVGGRGRRWKMLEIGGGGGRWEKM